MDLLSLSRLFLYEMEDFPGNKLNKHWIQKKGGVAGKPSRTVTACQKGYTGAHRQFLTFSICEVAYAEDVVGIRVMVLFNVGSFLWGVLQLHGHFLQLLVQLLKEEKKKDPFILCCCFRDGLNRYKVTRQIFPSTQSDRWTTTCCNCLLLQWTM